MRNTTPDTTPHFGAAAVLTVPGTVVLSGR